MRHVFMLVLLCGAGLALADPSTCAGGGVCVSSQQPVDLEDPPPPIEEGEGVTGARGTDDALALISRFQVAAGADEVRES